MKNEETSREGNQVANLVEHLDIESIDEPCRTIPRQRIVNSLNYLHFQDETVVLRFRHSRYNAVLSIEALPQPCSGESLTCKWRNPGEQLLRKLANYELVNIRLTDGENLLFAQPMVNILHQDYITLTLPENCFQRKMRKVRRHRCNNIPVEVLQSGIKFQGALIDFSALSFRIEISERPPDVTFKLLNTEANVTIIIFSRVGGEILYSGNCRIIKRTNNREKRIFVLEALEQTIQRYKQKDYRSQRQTLHPSPNIVFTHPFTGKLINLETSNLSASGFLVEESYEESVLVPGMILPQIGIEVAGDLTISCKAQVIHRTLAKDDNNQLLARCGIAAIDMGMDDQMRLSSLLHHAKDRKSYVSTRIDLNELWRFFFETGFIYPNKYALMHTKKEQFKETFKKLYANTDIARHFIYQERGRIQAHMTALRVYEYSWLTEHHASRSRNNRAGLEVMNQIHRYINDSYSFYTTHMSFIIGYYRPDNRFADRIYSGCVKVIQDPKKCSFDTFGYFSFNKGFVTSELIQEGLHLQETVEDDLYELAQFYEHVSSGLMLSALDLEPHMLHAHELDEEYKKIGFHRERHLFSLKSGGNVQAIFMVLISNPGLNMSDVTNCIHVFVLDSKNVSPANISSVLSALSKFYDQESIPVLLFPAHYGQNNQAISKKRYNLFVVDVQYSDDYLNYMEHLINKWHHEKAQS